MTASIAPERTKAPLIPPSTHRYADVKIGRAHV